MSFQHFNPSVDKLAEASDSRSSANGDSYMSDIKANHKRKQPVRESEEELRYPNKSTQECPPRQPADNYIT
uniref:Uncharacterized protein n=1 Tax=Kalanchoe fedtschenkoi TaxID=63787 RepID=A0A7N0UIV6_KALFE